MAEINLGNDTSLNVSLGEQTNLSTTVYDINYIPDYVKAEQERRANETIRIANEEERQENEQDRIALYEDLENKLQQDYWRGEKGDKGDTGDDGVSPTASITQTSSGATITITDASGTTTADILNGEKGDKGDRGEAGAIKFEIVASLPTVGEEDTIYLVAITPDEGDNNYEEYIYVNGEWELLGKIGVQVDLSDYVKNTDYAGSGNNKGGTVVLKTTYNVDTNANGVLYCFNKTYAQYGSMDNSSFISKGTLENVITGKGLVSNTDYAVQDGIGGVIKSSTYYATNIAGSGALYCNNYSYSQYSAKSDNAFISKGTLENVITGKDLTTKSYVDGLVGDIDSVLDALNGEVI